MKQIADIHKSVDYLKDQRLKREIEGVSSTQRMSNDKVWDRYLKDQTLSEYQRLQEMRKMASMIENRAMMDEKLLRNNYKGL